MDVRVIKITRARRHHFHRTAQTTAHLSTLVSPHHRFIVFLVFVLRIHRVCAMVRRDELLRAFDYVHLLRAEGNAVSTAESDFHGDHRPAARSNGDRLRHQYFRLSVPGKWQSGLSHHSHEHPLQLRNVLELFCFVRAILPQGVPGRKES